MILRIPLRAFSHLVTWTCALSGCASPRVVAPAIGVVVWVERRTNVGVATTTDTSVRLVVGIAPRPPLASVIEPPPSPHARRPHARRSDAPCRVAELCAWEADAAKLVATLLSHAPTWRSVRP